MRKCPVVALVTEAENRYCQGLMRGVLEFVRSHRPWSLFVVPLPVGAGWVGPVRCDGVICDAPERWVVNLVRRSRVSMVEMDQSYPHDYPHLVASDNTAIANLAARHLLECGLSHFGFVGYENVHWSRLRRQAFVATVEGAGHDCGVFESLRTIPADGRWGAELRDLARWLKTLPKPTGVMACNDRRGQHLLLAARIAGISVPEEVAVIGVDDDLICELCQPPLTSVLPDTEQIGWTAAALLDQLLGGKNVRMERRVFGPRGIVQRDSTYVSPAISDAEVASAVRLIREQACYGVTVADVMKRLDVSRAWLERRFRKCLGHSPQSEIRAAQVKRVKQLLIETDRSLVQIAELTGFKHPEYMGVVFKRVTGETPGAYRRRAHAGPLARNV